MSVEGFSYEGLQCYEVPDKGGIGAARGVPWGAQMWHVDQRILAGGRIISSGHVEALRVLRVTHVLSVDDEDLDARHWRDSGTRRWIPLVPGILEHGELPEEKFTAIGRWLEPILSNTSAKLYLHGKLGNERAAALAYFALRIGGMGPGLARSRVWRGRVSSEDELGRMNAGYTSGWLVPEPPGVVTRIDMLVGRWVSMLDYGVRPLALP